MLKDYRIIAKSLKKDFLVIENWPDIYLDKEAKSLLKSITLVKEVNDYSLKIVTGSENHVIIPSQYVLYAVKVKELALSIKEHLEVIDKAKDEIGAERIFKTSNVDDLNFNALDDFSNSIALKPIFDEEYNLNAKSFVNNNKGKYTFRALSDFFTSIILQVINVPNASSSILGYFIFELSKNNEVYEALEKKYIEKLEFIVNEKNINRFAQNVLTFLDNWDGLEKILELMEINTDESYYSVKYNESKLTSIFRISEEVLSSADLMRGGKERYFNSPIKQIPGKGYLYVSTEWTNEKGSRLDLQTFKDILDKIYGEFKIEAINGNYLLIPSNKRKILRNKFETKVFKHDLKVANLIYEDTIVEQFVNSLCTKPFLILTGLSGSGKTKLAQAFSEWIIDNENQIKIVPVGADWNNREPLLGYPNALNPEEYVFPDSGVLQLILHAKENLDRPYILILDEMNLSHVERYFADFLSAIESRKEIILHSGNNGVKNVPAAIDELPKNLFIIGTVNIDETTYMFSPKVLDRANVIEFRVSKDELATFLRNPLNIELDMLSGKGAGMANDFINTAINEAPFYSEQEKISGELLHFFEELKGVGAEFGYRTAFEIQRFAGISEKLSENWAFENVMDAAIIQKLLPKLHGSRRKLEKVLFKLGDLCYPDTEKGCEELFKKHEAISIDVISKAKYPISFEKIVRMHKGLVDNGFTSFAEA